MKAAELLYAECERRGFLTEYSREIEYRYTELYYAITLFSLYGRGNPSLSWLLSDSSARVWKNVSLNLHRIPTIWSTQGAPEQKLIRMQSRSDLLFFVYYRMKQWIWKKRGNL